VRENRTHGSEGEETETNRFPYPYPSRMKLKCFQGRPHAVRQQRVHNVNFTSATQLKRNTLPRFTQPASLPNEFIVSDALSLIESSGLQ
jgi:hypothetical protein